MTHSKFTGWFTRLPEQEGPHCAELFSWMPLWTTVKGNITVWQRSISLIGNIVLRMQSRSLPSQTYPHSFSYFCLWGKWIAGSLSKGFRNVTEDYNDVLGTTSNVLFTHKVSKGNMEKPHERNRSHSEPSWLYPQITSSHFLLQGTFNATLIKILPEGLHRQNKSVVHSLLIFILSGSRSRNEVEAE